MIIPTKFDYRTVALKEIDSEEAPFRITTNDAVSDLSDALGQVGLINPPVLMHQADRYVVVCGHRRVLAARALAWETIPARIPTSQNDPPACAFLAISENSIERPLNLIETSRALSLLNSFIPDKKERYRVAGNLGLPSNPSLIKKIGPLCRLPQQMQNGILSGEISLPSALMLSKLQPKAAVLISEFLIRLKLSLSKQKEMIVILQEIAIREDCTVEEIIHSEKIQSILDDPEMDRPRKSGLIRTYLKHRRFPNISDALDAFEKVKSSLTLGENTSLNPPPGFEGNHYRISFSFSSMNELDHHKQTLERLLEDERIKALLDSGPPKKK